MGIEGVNSNLPTALRTIVVLSGDTVIYGNAPDIPATLDYDFGVERSFSYKGLNKSGIVEHISHFVAYLWQIHAFGEGNTRTTAVFAILYLIFLGFEVDNDLFEKNSWYFRNALYGQTTTISRKA